MTDLGRQHRVYSLRIVYKLCDAYRRATALSTGKRIERCPL